MPSEHQASPHPEKPARGGLQGKRSADLILGRKQLQSKWSGLEGIIPRIFWNIGQAAKRMILSTGIAQGSGPSWQSKKLWPKHKDLVGGRSERGDLDNQFYIRKSWWSTRQIKATTKSWVTNHLKSSHPLPVAQWEPYSYKKARLIRCACDLYTASNLRFGTEVSLAFGYKGETLLIGKGDTNRVLRSYWSLKNWF